MTSNPQHIVTIDELVTGTSPDMRNIIHALQSKNYTEMTLGDIAMSLGSISAWDCTWLLVRKNLHHELVQALLPTLHRVCHSAAHPAVHEGLRLLEDYAQKKGITKNSLLCASNRLANHPRTSFKVVHAALVYAAENDDEFAVRDIAREALMSASDRGFLSAESKRQKVDITTVFLPICRTIHDRRETA
jgi:hypothetical protein